MRKGILVVAIIGVVGYAGLAPRQVGAEPKSPVDGYDIHGEGDKRGRESFSGAGVTALVKDSGKAGEQRLPTPFLFFSVPRSAGADASGGPPHTLTPHHEES